jgi:hypothetical protein
MLVEVLLWFGCFKHVALIVNKLVVMIMIYKASFVRVGMSGVWIISS